MRWFKEKPKELDTKEIQARLTGLVNKVIAQQHLSCSDGEKYEEYITELARRGEKPIIILQPKD